MTGDGTAVPTNTMVSNTAGGPYVQGTVSAGAAPGAQGLGANLQISNAILVIIGASAVALVALGYLFRK